MLLSTALFHMYVEQGMEGFTTVRQLLVVGETMSITHAKKAVAAIPQCNVINAYGPTENTSFSSCFSMRDLKPYHTSVPVSGQSLSNSQMYVLDKWFQPLPVGIPGEIYNSGDGLARGYLKREDLTAERFVQNELQPELSSRMYRTGDQAKYLADGNIEFMGRFDNQVKISGFRIELGEVEAVIGQYEKVSSVVVLAHEFGIGDKRLVGYILPKTGSDFKISDLKKYLRERLPVHMVPTILLQMEAFPLTPNGKVDKKQLPKPSLEISTKNNQDVGNLSPIESKLIRLWKEILRVNEVEKEDNFFELGGSSILAVRLTYRILQELGFNVPVTSIFSNPTIVSFNNYLTNEYGKKDWNSLVAVKEGGSKKPLYCIHPISGDVEYVFSLAKYLENDQPVYALRAKGLNGEDQPLRSIEEMAAHYLELILSHQNEGPYYLSGYSMGGLIAIEIATRLSEMGKEVGKIFLFDTYPHKRGKFTYLHIPIPAVLRSSANFLMSPKISASEKVATIKREFPEVKANIIKKFSKLSKQAGTAEVKSNVSPREKVIEVSNRASQSYLLQPFPQKVVFFRSIAGPARYLKNYHFGWTKFAKGGVDIFEFDEDHNTIFLNQQVTEQIAKVISKQLI